MWEGTHLVSNLPTWFREYDSALSLQTEILNQIASHKLNDPMAPVTLLVQNPLQGMILRRSLVETKATQGVGSLANIKVQTPIEFLGTLSEVLLGENIQPPSTSLIEATVYSVMGSDEESKDGMQSLATANAIAKVYSKLQLVDTDSVSNLLGRGELTSTQLSVLETVLKVRKIHEETLPSTLIYKLINSIQVCSDNQLKRIGQVHSLIEGLPTNSLRLFETLVKRGTSLSHYVLKHEAQRPLSGKHAELISCPDPATEVSMTARLVMGNLETTRADKIAILYPDENQYLTQLQDEFDAAGIAWHGKSRTIGQESVLYRSLSIILESLRDRNSKTSGFDRPKLMRLLQNGNLQIDGIRLDLVQVRKWVRKNELYSDAIYWLEILNEIEAEESQEYTQIARDHLQHLLKFMDSRLQLLAAEKTWSGLGRQLGLFLKALHEQLPSLVVGSAEEQSWEKIKTFLEVDLAALDEISLRHQELVLNIDFGNLLNQVRKQLGDKRLRKGNLSTGVLIAPIEEACWLSFEEVYLLGATEGLLPQTVSSDPFLDSNVLEMLGESNLAEFSRENDIRNLGKRLAAIAASSASIKVLRPRGGTNVKLENEQSRFLDDGLSDKNSPDSNQVKIVESFVSSFSSKTGFSVGPINVRDSELLKGLANPTKVESFERSMQAWRNPDFNEYFGNLTEIASSGPIWDPANSRPLSSSKIDSYLRCQYQFFATSVLRLSEDDRSDTLVDFSTTKFGIFFHKQMENFIKDLSASGKLPQEGHSWSESAAEFFVKNYFDPNLRRFTSTGRDGWRRSLQLHIDDVKANLPEFFRNEALALRSNPDLAIVAAEQSFGKVDDEIKLTVVDEDGVEYRIVGQMDRLDSSSDGLAAGVMDFKTGKRAKQIKKLGITKTRQSVNVFTLQDVIYSLAAKSAYPNATSVKVNFVFITEEGEDMFLLAPYSKDEKQLLIKTLKRIRESGDLGSFLPISLGTPSEDHAYCKVCSSLGDSTTIVNAKVKAQLKATDTNGGVADE